ncbi:hypothetical protein LPJ71_007065, partial [Coemansia sp. S17]
MSKGFASRKTSRRVAALSPTSSDFPPRGGSTSPSADNNEGRSSFQSTRSSISNPLSRLDSLRTHTTEFYSASSQFSANTNNSATSFHTATSKEPTAGALEAGLATPPFEPVAMSHHTLNSNSTISRSTNGRAGPAGPFTQLADESEDGDFAIAMARQYVLDAEAAGSASPSHRSRKGTDASRMPTDRSLGADVATASSEDYPPQVPPLRHMQGRDDDSTSERHHELTPELTGFGKEGRALSEQLRDEE